MVFTLVKNRYQSLKRLEFRMLKPIISSTHNLRRAWVLFLCLMFYHDVNAQRTPAELADLSLQELSSLKLDKELGENNSRWSFHYKFRYLEFNGYREGTENLSDSEVLFNSNIADRTLSIRIEPMLVSDSLKFIMIFE